MPELERFTSSLDVDVELAEYDVLGSLAHARALQAAGLLTKEQLRRVERGLKTVGRELESGKFVFADSDEDIHTAVERRLGELDADAAARLHTGRSRNDQVALDLRLYCRAAAAAIVEGLAFVVEVLATQARRHADWPMPGYAEPLLRDAGRAINAHEAAGELPLGAGALAGSTLPLDRLAAARELGFKRLTQNSVDAVSDRDFALDLAYACLSVGIHLSRLGEDVVLWASAEFGFVRLADEVATGSSLMPHKRNPDVAELLRGRSGRALGSLVALATVLKGLPLAYDRDLQEDKRALFDAVANCLECLEAAALLVSRLEFDRARLEAAVADPDLLATDTAERLVAAGRPFREAHLEVGRSVLEGGHAAPWDAVRSLQMRDQEGAPHPRRVAQAARRARRQAEALRRWTKQTSLH